MAVTIAQHRGELTHATARSLARTERRSRAFVYAFSAVYAGIFFAGAATNYLFFFTPRYDLGNMVQVVWSTAHGHFLEMSAPDGQVMSRLGAHVDPFLVLLVPLWWIWSNPLVLLFAQAVAVASGALPVYWLARKHLGRSSVASVFAIAYLLYSPTQFNTFTPYGIHAVSFAIPLVLYAIWFLDEDRLVPFGILASLAATTKEEIAAALGGLGIWYAFRRGRKGVGALIFVTGTAVSLVNFELVIPHFTPSGAIPYANRYAAVGGTPARMLRTAITDPGAFAHQLSTGRNLVFVILVFGPFLCLWALEPLMLVGALPDLAINVLSSDPGQTTISGHYTAGMVPFVVAASILGTARLRRLRFRPRVLLGVAFSFAVLSPLVYDTTIFRGLHGEGDAVRRAARLIPPEAPVSATRSVGGDVSTREVVLTFPFVGRASWLIVGPPGPGDPQRAFQRSLADVRSSPRWERVFRRDGVEVFKRLEPSSKTEQ